MNYYRGNQMPRSTNQSCGANATCNMSPSYRNSVADTSQKPCRMEKSEPVRGPLAIARVVWQKYENLYPEDAALFKGTLFVDLDLDFRGRRGF